MTPGDIHNMSDRLQTAVQKIRDNSNLSERDRELLLEFKDHLGSQDPSESRLCRHLQCIRVIAEATEEDLLLDSRTQINTVVGKINRNEIKEKDLSETTRAEYRKTLNKYVGDFLTSMRKEIDGIDSEMNGKELMEGITSTAPSTKPDPDRLPTPNTVRTLVENATNTRDKAFLMTLWSTGGRIGEILGLQWKDVKFKERKRRQIVQVHFRDTKTGQDRKVPFRGGLTFLNKWKRESTESRNSEAYVFHRLDDGKQLEYKGARKIIERAENNAGRDIEKKLNPHAFRKARATFLAAKGMNQATLCDYMGWVQGSDQAAVYIGLAESDKEDSILELSGFEVEQEEDERDVDPIQCSECQELNPFLAETCSECGSPIESSELYAEMEIEDKTSQFKDEVIMSETEFTPENINEKAKEFVREELDL
ncbi:MAG: tyrosine-type recombinase/integrase [Candidatus Nanosalina sp.]